MALERLKLVGKGTLANGKEESCSSLILKELVIQSSNKALLHSLVLWIGKESCPFQIKTITSMIIVKLTSEVYGPLSIMNYKCKKNLNAM